LHFVGAGFIVTLVADRFLRHHDRWFDIATAEQVSLAVHPAGSLRLQIAWAEQCSMLSRLRHPLMNPLLDYGAADATSLFEAYALAEPVVTAPAAVARFTRHAGRFLEAHGVSLAAGTAAMVFREIRHTATHIRRRPVGFVLQPRRAYGAVTDLLTASLRGGVTAATIAGARGSGLRTCRTAIAHTARAHGYVPVCPAALARWPELLVELSGRHVCLIAHSGAAACERAAAAVLLARLARRSARPHVCLTLDRTDHPARGALHLEPMGTTTMTSMLYVDPDDGPSSGDLFEAARCSGGLPARFLAQLGARTVETTRRAVTVHESTAGYVPSNDAAPITNEQKRSRIGSVLWRASRRATELEARGRHASAARLLTRAAHVLEGRGETQEAAHCWRQLAWTARNRGATTAALERAERAGQTDSSPEGQMKAAWLVAICWTDSERFIEAEASLRNLVAGAATIGNTALQHRCLVALARVLCRTGHSHEALDVLDRVVCKDDVSVACEVFIRRARIHLQSSDVRSAIQAAREGIRIATDAAEPRLRAAAHLVMADSLGAAGDVDGVRHHVGAGLKAATDAHLPLAALRLRAALLRAIGTARGYETEAAHLRASLQRAIRHPLPALTRRLLEDACRDTSMGVHYSSVNPAGPSAPARLEDFLEIAQRAADDVTAVADVLSALCERTGAVSSAVLAAGDGRVLAAAGRPWREKPAAASRAASSGRPVPVEESPLPLEAGEPVRCGGALVGAIGTRWLIGAVVPSSTVAATLRAASLAIATHVRALVDALPAEPPAGVWSDLIGESAVATALRESALRASRAPFPVLIEGESGSGKELVARAIHRLSPRHTRRFCAINCAALSDELVEAELFGHTRGAFTGATTERAGLFEEADGGTLFLDEVGELSARAQAKLLRVLQEGEVRRVGENLPRRVDVRIVAATNRRLEDEAAHGRFRVDLRFRLDVLRIVVPPLRERIPDIPLIAQHFWRQACARVGSQATLGPETLAALSRYDWPGNVRELQNAIAWIAVHAPRRGRVSASMLPARLASSPMATGSFEAAREEFERRYVRAALAQAGGQRQAAARALGVSRQGLAKMLRRLQIEP
jgi:DNA-binding NtrC family response regulator/tetratricopeptide (TPR) repeat protein